MWIVEHYINIPYKSWSRNAIPLVTICLSFQYFSTEFTLSVYLSVYITVDISLGLNTLSICNIYLFDDLCIRLLLSVIDSY